MSNKFKQVVEEYSKLDLKYGDEILIHNLLAKCSISIVELPAFARYLASEYSRTENENNPELNTKIEQLQYAVNFIFEARRLEYKVRFKTIYINQEILK